MNKRTISKLITVLVLGLFAWYFKNNREEFAALGHIRPIYLLIVLLGVILMIFTNALIIKWIMEPFDKYISLSESMYVSVMSSAGNFFLPVGSGTGFRAVYLSKVHKLNYKNFFSTLYGNYVIVFLIGSLFGVSGLVALKGWEASSGRLLLIVFSGLASGSAYAALVSPPKVLLNVLRTKLGRLGRIAAEVFDGWAFITSHRMLLAKMIAAVFLNLTAAMMISYASLAAVGVHVSFWVIVVHSSLGVLTLLINITPGSIGIKEGMYIFSSSTLRLTTPQILSAVVIDRSTRFIVLFVSWLFIKWQKIDQKQFASIEPPVQATKE